MNPAPYRLVRAAEPGLVSKIMGRKNPIGKET